MRIRNSLIPAGELLNFIHSGVIKAVLNKLIHSHLTSKSEITKNYYSTSWFIAIILFSMETNILVYVILESKFLIDSSFGFGSNHYFC